MSRPDWDRQFAETVSERNERLAAKRRRGNSKLVYDKAEQAIVAVKTGQCDCCGKEAELTKLVAYGIDTSACLECRGETASTYPVRNNSKRESHHEIAGQFYWPSDEYSIPADDLCWHVPPAPDRDFRCVRPFGHPGLHQYAWSPTVKPISHKQKQDKAP